MSRVRSSKLFDRESVANFDFDEPLAIMLIEVCLHTRTFAVSGAAGHIIIYNFDMEPIGRPLVSINVSVLEVSNLGDSFEANADSGLEDKISLKLRSTSGSVSQTRGRQSISGKNKKKGLSKMFLYQL